MKKRGEVKLLLSVEETPTPVIVYFILLMILLQFSFMSLTHFCSCLRFSWELLNMQHGVRAPFCGHTGTCTLIQL